jgi:hypothetical protein
MCVQECLDRVIERDKNQEMDHVETNEFVPTTNQCEQQMFARELHNRVLGKNDDREYNFPFDTVNGTILRRWWSNEHHTISTDDHHRYRPYDKTRIDFLVGW